MLESDPTAYGLFEVTVGIENLFASLLTGYIWTRYGNGTSFIIGSVTAGIAAFLLLYVDYQTHKHTPAS